MRRFGWMGIVLLAAALLLSLPGGPGYSQNVLPTAAPGALSTNYIRADRLGITFISSEHDQAQERYRNALLLGAGWNRWPLYWNVVEAEKGQFNWQAYDSLVGNDLRNGLKINAIFLGKPDFYSDNGRPLGIFEPIFADGSDLPGEGKSFNPNNPWVNFVFAAVERYKPGGLLARQQAWGPDEGIRIWEVWNEPDHKPFWGGSIEDYARLLKISYIAIKQADPQSTVMFGGLLFSTPDNWLARVLDIYQQSDPNRGQFNWYFDAVAIHNYNYPWRSGWLTLFVRQTLKSYDLLKPIWLNETGVAVWDDYPGPVWASETEDRILRATAEQQAWFFIQSTAYAWSEGAQVVFFHQLYDDCGNQPGGTDFPPHNGELCSGGACMGDAFGIFRNPIGAACFSRHPFPNTPRPIASAYLLLAEVFGPQPFNHALVENVDGKATIIRFQRPNTDERILVMWNRTFEPYTLNLTASDIRAQLFTLEDSYTILPNESGVYSLNLPPALPDRFPDLADGDLTAIGGPPMILIEKGDLEAPDTVVDGIDTQGASGTPSVPVPITPGPVIPPPAPPTIDPANDTTPPSTSIEPLPQISQVPFTVRWNGSDDSGIDYYLVWVRIDGGEWLPWLETARTEADYSGGPGQYEFAVWAVDLAGNWSTNTDLQAQSLTRVE